MIFFRPFLIATIFLLPAATKRSTSGLVRAAFTCRKSFSSTPTITNKKYNSKYKNNKFNSISKQSKLTMSTTAASSTSADSTLDGLQDIIGTDAGNRGMKSLIVPGDFRRASDILGTLTVSADKSKQVVILSGFPCCVNESPPTETDGPPGTFAIARAAAALGHSVVVVTDACNEAVFAAAMKDLAMPDTKTAAQLSMQVFPAQLSADDETQLQTMAQNCDLLISCERAGPGKDGNCYTMRGIDMTAKGLIAPLHRLVQEVNAPFLAIGDGGNELGMGKVMDEIVKNPKIADGNKIGCAVAADFLIAASVSNWGGYALAAGAAVVRARDDAAKDTTKPLETALKEWVDLCLPSDDDEIALLNRCVAVGCRDGVSGLNEATVDGMPLESSLQCLRDLRAAALSAKP
jgi:hypothetical protein